MVGMKVFWSWQSDTPGKTGRHFVRNAIVAAIEQLKEPSDIEEPSEREAKEGLHLDHDRQNVSGSPDLARTILEKIEQATVVIADVTPVATIPAQYKDGQLERSEKRVANPNVAIELGYALHTLTDRNVLMVLNTWYGGREFLPFDLAHKAGPILYYLAPDADKKTTDSEAASLTSKLVNALKPYLAEAARRPALVDFPETPSTLSAAAYFQANEALATVGDERYGDQIEYCYPDGQGFYLRLIPTTPRDRPFTKAELIAAIERLGLSAMWQRPSGLYKPNRYGAFVVEPENVNGPTITASTQVFPNGELWGINRRLLTIRAKDRQIGGKAFEDIYRQTLRRYVDFMEKVLPVQPPYTIEAGAVGIKGFSIVVDTNGVEAFGPFHDETFKTRFVLNATTQQALDAASLKIFEDYFGATGYARPIGLFGFQG
jgi:hypothetical protein